MANLTNSQEPEPGVFGSFEPEQEPEPEPLGKKIRSQEPEPEKNLPAPQPCLHGKFIAILEKKIKELLSAK